MLDTRINVHLNPKLTGVSIGQINFKSSILFVDRKMLRISVSVAGWAIDQFIPRASGGIL